MKPMMENNERDKFHAAKALRHPKDFRLFMSFGATYTKAKYSATVMIGTEGWSLTHSNVGFSSYFFSG